MSRTEIFAGPGAFGDYLDGAYAAGDARTDYLIRDYYERPWIVSFDDSGDPFVGSIPYEDDSGVSEEPDKYHGDLHLPIYPIRIIKETTND